MGEEILESTLTWPSRAEQPPRCSDMAHSVHLKVASMQKPSPSREIPALGVVGIWDRHLGTVGSYCWMWLYWGCCWIPW